MILAVCLSPALQRTLVFESFSMGRVNRAVSANSGAGGKGINASRVAVQLGERVLCLTCLGGSTGKEVASILKNQGVRSVITRLQSATRICTTVLSPDSETELVEEPAPVLFDEIQAVQQSFLKQVRRSRFVILTGTVPPGFSNSIYRQMGEMAASLQISFLVDAVGPLFTESLKAKPDAVKLNRQELETWSGIRLDSYKRIDDALGKLIDAGAKNALITGWLGEAWAMADDRLFRLHFPELRVVNTIGSGDAASAGIAAGFVRNLGVQESFRLGVACACANVLTPTAGSVNLEDVERILPEVIIEIDRECQS